MCAMARKGEIKFYDKFVLKINGDAYAEEDFNFVNILFLAY